MNKYDDWKKKSTMYWVALALMLAILIVSAILVATGTATGLVVQILLYGSGVAVTILFLIIIRYLLNMAKPSGKGKRR